MIAQKPGGYQSASQKYDLLTLLGVVGLSGNATQQRSMLRLMTLVTARYNWRAGEITVGRREMARLWGVNERTVKREMARLRALGFVALRRPGLRGRVAAYTVNFDAIRADCDLSRVGPDFEVRLATETPTPSQAAIIPFPGMEEESPESSSLTPWSVARCRLTAIGAAAHHRWIAPLHWGGISAGRVTLLAPSAYHAAFVERTHADAILEALCAADGSVTGLRIDAAPRPRGSHDTPMT